MNDRRITKMGSAIKALWHKSGSPDSLKEFARGVAKDPTHFAQSIAKTWLNNKAKK